MAELIWNEGMSVGIDAIDEDHKQIISILAKLNSAYNQQISNQIIEGIFAELEHYVILHFAREEALLEKACYPDLVAHKASHQKFVERLPELRDQWLTENNASCCEKITHFLHQWLIKHILEDDLNYVPTLFNSSNETIKQLYNQKPVPVNNSLLAKFSTSLAKKVKLSKRIFIATLVPLIVVLILSLLILQDNYQRYKNISLVLGLTEVIKQVNELSHSLQAERGLSSGYTSSEFHQFNEQLTQQRNLTDEAVTKFLVLINRESSSVVKTNISLYSEDVHKNIEELAQYRQQLDNQSVSFLQLYQFYTELIAQLLSVSDNLTHVDMKSKLVSDIVAINAVLAFKESMGQIRALGMDKATLDNNDIYRNLDISLLVGQQLNMLKVFHYSANSQQKKECADFCNESIHLAMLKQMFAHAVDGHKKQDQSQQWFNLMSAEIDQLKVITDRLVTNFNKTLIAENQKLKTNYFVMLVVLSMLLFFIGVFALIINFSIIAPIRQITKALNGMVKGHRNVQFRTIIHQDEIGAMQQAYEKLRRKLLQVDIFQAIVNSQKKEIEYIKSQQKHFETLAFTDALTGAVNRHQFNKVLAEEIARANYEYQPLSILMLDIDFFKKINDNYGHSVGDEVLIMFYRACKEAARQVDIVARIGGEEFVIILPKTNLVSAHQFAERLREKIEHLTITVDDSTIQLTVSIGVSQWLNDTFANAEDFIADADKSLYQAKSQGRNRVVS